VLVFVGGMMQSQHALLLHWIKTTNKSKPQMINGSHNMEIATNKRNNPFASKVRIKLLLSSTLP